MYWLSLIGVYRRARAFILRRGVRIEGSCNMCGECCRKIVLMYDGDWLVREEEFQGACRENPEYERFKIVGKSEEGLLMFDCSLQDVDNSCREHDSRMNLCKRYPSETMYYRGGRLLYGCGYRFVEWTWRDAFRKLLGITPPNFETTLKRELNRLEDGHDS